MREPYNCATCGNSVHSKEILIILSRNVAARDWSVFINGQRHEHVPTEVVEALVECEMIIAETSLTAEPDYALDAPVRLEAMGRP